MKEDYAGFRARNAMLPFGAWNLGYRFLPEVRRPALESGRPITVRVTVEMTLDEGQTGPGEDEIARRVATALTRRERRELRALMEELDRGPG